MFILLGLTISSKATSHANGALRNDGDTSFISRNIGHLAGGSYIGENGKKALESIVLKANPNTMIHTISTRGGDGWRNTMQERALVVSNAFFAGGNAGSSIGVTTNANAYALGGSGAAIDSPLWTVPPIPSPGDGGVIIISPVFPGEEGSLLTNSAIDVIDGGFIGGGAGPSDRSSGSDSGGNGGALFSLETAHDQPRNADALYLAQATFQGGHGGAAEGAAQAASDGGTGLHISSFKNIHIDHVQAVAGSGGASIGSKHVDALGGTALSIDYSTNVLINAGVFQGGGGGNAKHLVGDQEQGFVAASGGDGVHGSLVRQALLNGVTGVGGNGGTATAENTSRPIRAVANGGAGANFNHTEPFHAIFYPHSMPDSPARQVVRLENGFFHGGDGGLISGNIQTESFWSASSAKGGNGVEFSSFTKGTNQTINQVILHRVHARGGRGGYIRNDSEGRSSSPPLNASGGHGALIENMDNTIIDGGYFLGGDGGTIKHENVFESGWNGSLPIPPLSISPLPPSGGDGMRLISTKASILNGVFEGGQSIGGGPSGGSGLYFIGNSLDIHDGLFIATESPGFGLHAQITSNLNIYGGWFDSIKLSDPYGIGLSPIELHISSNAVITGSINLAGHYFVPEVDQGTFQRVSLNSGQLRFGDTLTLNADADFRANGVIDVPALIAESGALLSIGNTARIDKLEIRDGATLHLASNHGSYRVSPSSSSLGDISEIIANNVIFGANALLLIDHRTIFRSGLAQGYEVARISATKLEIDHGLDVRTMTQDDLNALSSAVANNYLMDYDFELVTSTNQQRVVVRAAGVPLAEKEDNPLPVALAVLIDEYRSSGLIFSRIDYDSILQNLNAPSTHAQAKRELKRYFATATTPMVAQAIQAEQQARLDQVLDRINALREPIAPARLQPDGAKGPPRKLRSWSGWMKGYGTRATKDADADFAGYDADIGGVVIGIEKALETAIVGLAGGSARTGIDGAEQSSSDIDTWFGSLYGSYGMEQWFIDATLSYGHNTIESKRGGLFPAEARYNSRDMMAYLGTGRRHQISEGFAITPELGGQINFNDQDSFTESGVMNNTYEAYEHWSFKSILGAEASWLATAGKLSFHPALRVRWKHNFNADPGRITYTTEGSGIGSSATIQSPQEDTLLLGAGLEIATPERFMIDVRLDQQMASGWRSTTLSGSFKLSF